MNQTQPPDITPELLEQHPELVIPLAMVFGLFLFYAVGGIGSWVYFFSRLQTNKPLLPLEPWSPRVWGLVDLLIVLVAIVLGQSLFATIGVRLSGMDMGQIRANDGAIPIGLALWAGIGNLCAMLMMVLYITRRFGVPVAHIGFGFKQLPWHLILGVLVALASLPVIYVLMMLVSAGFKSEYSHPLIQEMSERGTLNVYLMGIVTAAIIAPITEEFLFRVIIQGWLQSIPFKSTFANILGGWYPVAPRTPIASLVPVAEQVVEYPADVDASSTSQSESYVANTPSEQTAGMNHELEHAGAGELDLVPPVWPSIVSGILFGLAHWGFGLSFIPLIALGIVLGMVYRATHSIWPCIVIHGMLNSTSMALLGFTILMQRAA